MLLGITLLTVAVISAQESEFDSFINQFGVLSADEAPIEDEGSETEDYRVGTEDDLTFGFANGNAGASAPLSVAISGEASASAEVFLDELASTEKMKQIELGDFFSGSLNFFAQASNNAEAVINMKLSHRTPILTFDEAYVRGYFGPLSVEAGLRKLTWGKADSLGPLDVVNPLDYTDLLDMTSVLDRKIAVPMIHLSYGIGTYSKLEAVFVPSFTPQRFAQLGDRWAPSQLTSTPSAIKAGATAYVTEKTSNPQFENDPILAGVFSDMEKMLLASMPSHPSYKSPDTPVEWLKYMQAGLRFTTTVKSADVGVQGYFGRLPRPVSVLTGFTDVWDGFNANTFYILSENEQKQYFADYKPTVFFDYNYFAQLGFDYAQELLGFNTRAELAVNLTKDLKGDDGEVYNPFIGWSLGFDRDIAVKDVLLFNVNLQVNENVRLFSDKINDNRALDTEAGSNDTATRVTLIASRKFFREEFEINFTGLWGVEDMDFYVIPGLVWAKENLAVRLNAGVFFGNSDGELGQYHNNNFIRMVMTYTF
ncbi:MAG: hypothetical protein LBK25_00910 [Treponema sp.]|nr:hypothetical protein [Treponema sp.]